MLIVPLSQQPLPFPPNLSISPDIQDIKMRKVTPYFTFLSEIKSKFKSTLWPVKVWWNMHSKRFNAYFIALIHETFFLRNLSARK